MECKYCNNTFKTISSLNNHIKTAKYCLALRQDSKSLYVCEYCNSTLSSKFRLQTHLQICSQKNEQILCKKDKIIHEKDILITKLEKEVSELKVHLAFYKELSERELSCMEDIARQPRNQTTNNTQNTLINMTPFDMNKENFAKTIEESFTKEYLLEGQKGVAKFAVDNLLKDENGKLKYVCTDPSRQIYRFKTLDGGLERDVKAKKLTRALADNLTKKSHTLSMEELEKGDTEVFVVYTSNFQDIKELHDDNGDFRTELASLTTV
jgi:hypothetical protein